MDNDKATNWEEVVTEVGVPLEGLEFIYSALVYTPQYCGEEPGDVESQSRHCTAHEFCHAFVRFAKDTFGKDYAAALTLWGLDTSEKLGRVVFHLVDRGYLQRQEGDSQSDFDGRFDVSADAS